MTPAPSPRPPKIPRSVLVVIHNDALDVLLIERADRPGYWQSVTGSLDADDEPPSQAAWRELAEETGIGPAQSAVLTDWQHQVAYTIYPQWRHRYAPGVTRNTEHWFGVRLPGRLTPTLNPREHTAHVWLPWEQAAERCFSPSNAEAIRSLPLRAQAAGVRPAGGR
jgi:dihydroneopterin triphosphate diphosphatase